MLMMIPRAGLVAAAVAAAAVAVLAAPRESQAQVPAGLRATNEPAKRSFDIQVDPLPFFLKGFTLEVGYSVARHRFSVNALGYDVPDMLNKDDRFSERRNLIVGASYSFFFLRHLEGPYLGAGLSNTNSTFTLEATGNDHRVNTGKFTGRIGWALFPLKVVPDLFLNPWIGATVNLNNEKFTIDEQRIDRPLVGFVGALQVGWRF